VQCTSEAYGQCSATHATNDTGIVGLKPGQEGKKKEKAHTSTTATTGGHALGVQAGAKGAGMSVLQIPVDSSASVTNYTDYFTLDGETLAIDEDAVVLFATSPNAAEGLWRAALEKVRHQLYSTVQHCSVHKETGL